MPQITGGMQMADQTQITPKFHIPLRVKSPVTFVLAILLVAALFSPSHAWELAGHAAASFVHTLPYIMLAVIIVAYLKAAGADAIIATLFKGREVYSIFLAAGFGGLAPFCSCEVIPFVSALLALGAPLSAVMAFWLSSPLLDPPTFLITAAALGWPFAVAKAVSAVGLGLFGGFVVYALRRIGFWGDVLRPNPIGGCGCGPSPITQRPVWAFWSDPARNSNFRDTAFSNLWFLSKWLFLAYVLEAVMITHVPSQMIASTLGGDGVVPIITAAVVGMPAYLNGFVAPPLLAGLMEQGMSAGAALAFMIAGSVSCIPAMAAVWSLVKPRVFLGYVVLGLLGAILGGLAFGALM